MTNYSYKYELNRRERIKELENFINMGNGCEKDKIELDFMKNIDEEYNSIQKQLFDYKYKKINEIIDFFKIERHEEENMWKGREFGGEYYFDNLCVYKFHKGGIVYHRIKNIKFDDHYGKYYFEIYRHCYLNKIANIYDIENYKIYKNDKNEFNNEEVKNLKKDYFKEDSIKKREEIRGKIYDFTNKCIHYFDDKKMCEKCGCKFDGYLGVYQDLKNNIY